jgi:hypothetical protein
MQAAFEWAYGRATNSGNLVWLRAAVQAAVRSDCS